MPSHLVTLKQYTDERRKEHYHDGRAGQYLPAERYRRNRHDRVEICELFGVIAPTVRAGIKALCKSGVLSVYDIRRIIRISDRYRAEVYNLETIAALAFRIESFGAAKVRKVLLERIIHGRKENSMIFLSLNVGSQAVISS